MPPASGATNSAAGKLLPLYHKLQDAMVAVGGNASQAPKLPQIVVVGSQSSGKSSVLEAFVGRDFLPRGSGIVTRRPLVLQLIHTPVSGEGPEEWGEFLHAKSTKYTDFAEIRAEIEAETERALGKTKRVSSDPIRLAIYSPNVVDLSLVDLPGVTKVPIADQPADIEQQLRQMVLAYIEPEESIILAVSAATSDLATSDAIQLAKRVDPDGLRTMGVITKLDLMDAGTDAVDVLKGYVIPLRKGFVGVVNRSQKDIVDGKPIAEARAAEHKFFEEHPRYRSMAGTMGTGYLAKRLNEMLLSHIRARLPDLQGKVHAALSAAKSELANFGDSRLEGGSNMGALVLQLIHKFCSNYCEAIDGTSAQVQEASRASGELLGGAKINHIFRSQFAETINTVDPCSNLSDADISRAIRQATGPRTPLFVPEGSFEVLARQQIRLLRTHCLNAVEMVLAELQRLLPACLPPAVLRYQVLQSRMQQCGHRALQRRERKASEMVNNLIDIELAYLNTSHPDFVGGGTAMRLVAQQLQAAADEQQYQASLDSLATQAPPPPPQLPPPVAVSAPAPTPGPPPMAATASDPLGATPGAGAENGSTFLNQFFGAGNSSSRGVASVFNGAAPAPPPPPPPPPSAVYNHTYDPTSGQMQTRAPYTPAAPAHARATQTREQLETDIIRSLLVSYYGIVKKNLLDSVPKAIMHFLVNSVRANIQEELVIELYKENEFAEMLMEADDAVRKREECLGLVRTLEKAHRVVDELRAMPIDGALEGGLLESLSLNAGQGALSSVY